MANFPFHTDELPPPSGKIETPPPALVRQSQTAKVQQALALPSFSGQVDKFAEIRGYFRPDEESETYPAITAFLASEISINEAVARIAAPIERAYTTADHGRKLASCSKRNTTYEGYTTEGYLWDLYYGILHAARRIPWDEGSAQQEKLLDLLKTLKARPDPEPSFKVMKIKSDWVLSEEGLWSRLLMMGPSARESWNDSPGCGAGYEVPEIRAWTNVNAFIARVTQDDVRDFWLYCRWATRDALEERYRANESHKVDATAPAAAAWIVVLGEQIYRKVQDRPQKIVSDPDCDFTTTENWNTWKRRFSEIAEDLMFLKETRHSAAMARDKMHAIERKADGQHG